MTNIQNKHKQPRRARHETSPPTNASNRSEARALVHHGPTQKNTSTQNKPQHTKHKTIPQKQAGTTRRPTTLPLVRATHSHNSRSPNRRRQMASRHTRTQRPGQSCRSMQTLQQFTRSQVPKHKTFTQTNPDAPK